MIIKQMTLATLDTGTLDFGFVGENEHIKFVIKCDSVFDEYPTATASLLIKAPDNTIYPKTVEVEGYNVGWVITASDTAYPGSGQIQLTFTEDGAVVKTVIANTNVKDSLVGDDPPPDPIADWISTANQILGKVDGMTASAESLPSGNDPSVTVETVDGHYNLEFGIPAGDPGDPTEIIDDNAGVGDVTKVWSANKSATELSELKSAIDAKAPCIYRDASGDIVTVTDGADGMPLKECVVGVNVEQDGTGDPSPENIRPIYGKAQSRIYRTGKNLLNPASFASNRISVSDGVYTFSLSGYTANLITGQNGGSHVISAADMPKLPVLGPGTYVWSFKHTSGSRFDNVNIVDNAGNRIATNVTNIENGTYCAYRFTLTETSKICIIRLSNGNPTVFSEPQIELGTERTAFEPYIGQTYPITFPDSAGTVYGGEVGMKAEKLTVNALATDMGSLSWTYNADGTYPFFYAALPAPARRRATLTYGISLCEIYKPIPNVTGAGFASEDHDHEICINSGYAGGYRVIVQDSSYTDADTFAAAVSGKLLVAPLASGIEYPIDPVQITTLPGYNAIWSDTGAVAVTYPADTKTYVDDHTPVQDVQINGVSVLSDGVANVPRAIGSGDTATLGVVRASAWMGIGVSDGTIYVNAASDTDIKSAASDFKPVSPYRQHNAAFYGLAKAAGADMASSSNPVGQYTDAAKVAIQKMLGVYQAPWELIREDTGTNATSADISITVDGNGNPFELTDIRLLFMTPQQDTEAVVASPGRVRCFQSGTNTSDVLYIGTYTQAAQATARVSAVQIVQRDGMLERTSWKNNSKNSERSPIVILTEPGGTSIWQLTAKTYDKVVVESVTGTWQYWLFGKRKWN